MKNLFTIAMIIFSFYVLFGELKKVDFNSQNDTETELVDDDVQVIIRGLNQFDDIDLITVKNTIEKTYGLNCEISDPVQVNCQNSVINCNDAQIQLGGENGFVYDENEVITIYVTSLDMSSSETSEGNNLMVKGLCFGNSVFLKKDSWLKSVTIHEFSHNYIYEHCKNNCIMAEYGEGWNHTKDTPIFCDNCKSQLPSELSSKLP